jgi:hypothetical protein
VSCGVDEDNAEEPDGESELSSASRLNTIRQAGFEPH